MAALLAIIVWVLYPTSPEGSRDQILVLAGGGALFLAGIFLVQILESQQAAGAVHNVKRRLEELRAGCLSARVTLRRNDPFQELASTFNEAVESLRSRTEGELATLSRLGSQVNDLLREEDRGNRAAVRNLAESLRRALAELERKKADLLRP